MKKETFVELFRFFSKKDDTLYLGDESLLDFCCESFKKVTCVVIERPEKTRNLKVVEGNPLTINIKDVKDTAFDSIINNLAVDVMKSFQVLERFLPLLKEDGRVLIRLETGGRSPVEMDMVLKALFSDFSLETIEYFELDEKKYVLVKKG